MLHLILISDLLDGRDTTKCNVIKRLGRGKTSYSYENGQQFNINWLLMGNILFSTQKHPLRRYIMIMDDASFASAWLLFCKRTNLASNLITSV